MRKTTVLGLVLLLPVLGCGGKGDVSGHVNQRGESVTLGWVLIFGSDGLPYRGQIQPDGSYVVKDVPTGEAKVGVSVEHVGPLPERSTARRDRRQLAQIVESERSKQRSRGGPNASAKESRPKSRSDPLESGLTCTVKRGANVFDIKLD